MKIVLAGYNIEKETMERLNLSQNMILTPEIFSAAYARISRSEKNIDDLRAEARLEVEKSRKSNQTIIFQMGHHSVAEHAVFNFDIMGVSRLALEEIEHFRLASYTEKSQRYVTLQGDYIIPNELKNSSEIDEFHALIEKQNQFYKRALPRLADYFQQKYAIEDKKGKNETDIVNLAKEDARYALSLATAGQVGLTINARNLEHLFRRFFKSRLAEVQKIGQEMYDLVYAIAPSIILFPQPSRFEIELPKVINTHFNKTVFTPNDIPEFRLLDYSSQGDERVLSAMMAISQSVDVDSAADFIDSLTQDQKQAMLDDLFSTCEFFDTPPREFELADITFQAIISASSFAQLKRHRMATLLPGPYCLSLKNTVPKSIEEVGLADMFQQLIEETNHLYSLCQPKFGQAADYMLTNSHRRLVIMKMNLRELYHFIRLRDDDHAQWDIRHLAGKILKEARRVFPLTAMMLCGKSSFCKEFDQRFQKAPQQKI
jgi:flavin-dependent thymidylate synthase